MNTFLNLLADVFVVTALGAVLWLLLVVVFSYY
jgi:hypothetical protein